MTYNFENHIIRFDSPATQAFAITPSDDNDLAVPVRALYIGSEGTLKITPLQSENPIILAGLVPGLIIPIVTRKVWIDSTSVTGIIGLL